MFAAIFRIHWALFALCLVLFPLTLLPSLLLSKKLYALHLEEQRAAGAGIRFLQETMDPLPGVVSVSTNMILSRMKDIKGLRL